MSNQGVGGASIFSGLANWGAKFNSNGRAPALDPPAVTTEDDVSPKEFVTDNLASSRVGVVGIEDLPNMSVPQQQAITAAHLVTDAETLALAVKALKLDDLKREPGKESIGYTCGSNSFCGDCNVGSGTNDCSAACVFWKEQWQPILQLINASCEKHDGELKSALEAPTIVGTLTKIRSNFDALKGSSDVAAMQTRSRQQFLQQVDAVLCGDIPRDFHGVRTQIREQMCKIDQIAESVQDLCASAFGSFSHDSWPAKDAKFIANHVAQCKPSQVDKHLETLASTAAALCVAEASVCGLAQWCTANLEGLEEQKQTILRAMPKLGKPIAPDMDSNWTRDVSEVNMEDFDIWQEHVFGTNNCTPEKFTSNVCAYVNAEPNCMLIYENAAIFFQECYRNLAHYMDEHIERVKSMEKAFVSLADALVQQRFVVEIGAFLMRCVSGVPLPLLANGKPQTSIDIFGTMFGTHFLKKASATELIKMQVELDSKGNELRGYTRKIIANIYSPTHMNSIQRVAQRVFTTELTQLGDLLTKCDQFRPMDGTANAEQWRAACKEHVDANMLQLSKLALVTNAYLAKKHDCATQHCECCPASTLTPKRIASKK
jgi:hypothetical protein